MSILLDSAKIAVEIDPNSGMNIERIKELGLRERSTKKIMIAEDSAILRKLLKDTLTEAGYGNLKFFENGKEAWEYLEAATKNEAFTLEDEVNLMISDIEMPQMDGHHLTDK